MGNSLGAKKTVKIMKVTGETIKLKTPVQAGDIVKDYPGHVLLESETVKHYGVRAKPLETHKNLDPKRLYFLVELPPQVAKERFARRVRSGITMSAKDRLESLMLARRSTSDLSILKPASVLPEEEGSESGAVRVRMKLPKGEVERLMKESRDEGEAAEKIMGLYMVKSKTGEQGNRDLGVKEQMRWDASHGRVGSSIKTREKRVSFLPINESEIQIAVAT